MKTPGLSASLVALSIILTQCTEGFQLPSQYGTVLQNTNERTRIKRRLDTKEAPQEVKSLCPDTPPWPRNSRISCAPDRCTSTCLEGYTFPGGSTTETIVCKNGAWVDSEGRWAIIPDCRPVINCSGGKVHMPCGPAKGQPRCDGATGISNNASCVEGCYCPEGTLLNGDQCITKEKCPCMLGEKSFPAGSKVPDYCNTCTCAGGKWDCTDIFCGCRCTIIGDPHYTTFDGKKFDFMGRCSYYLVKNRHFSIEAENVGWDPANNPPKVVKESDPSYTRTVTININGQTITLKQKHGLVVNGEDIAKMPYSTAGVSITRSSSILMIVKLPNGVQVHWDGHYTVHIDAPVQLKGQTKGLCGTYNKNEADDFLNPENKIEKDAIHFGNTWKISEKCENLPNDTNPHPCDSNKHMKAAAEKHCSKIKSEIFTECHWHLKPDEYYEDCLYDMCSCDVAVSNCLCPILAGYATECYRKAQIKLDWRSKVRECGVLCPRGQKYQVCGNSCTRSCGDIALDPLCTNQCVEGCNCPDGQTLDGEGTCIPIGQCKCQQDGLEFPAGYKEVRGTPSGLELCTCTNAVWQCKKASSDETKNIPKDSDRKNMCSASANMEFTTCKPYEPVTCMDMDSPHYSASVCQVGCQCKEGYVLDATSKNCVRPTECPCYLGGRSYEEDSVVQRDCNTCQCQKGKWKCTDKVCTAECSSWGNSHYKTFDGKQFDYQGQCDYVLAKGSSGLDSFEVSIENVPCGSLGTACTDSVTVTVSSGKDTESVTFAEDKPIPKYKTYKYIIVREVELFGTVEAPNLGLVVHWNKGTWVYVRVDARWKNKIKGLCGNYNGNNTDDFQTPTGGLAKVSVFVDSWALQAYCPEALEVPDTCEDNSDRMAWALKRCSVLKSPLFAPCHVEVPLGPYYEKCVYDSCACDQGGDSECVCTALAAYAQECNNRGVPIKWRSQQLCPIECDEWGSNYSPCISTCPIETCHNLAANNKLSEICDQEPCIEGCSPKPCPPGFIYSNSAYPHCVPRNSCRSSCLEGRVTYYEGDIMEEDDCHICYCFKNEKICKGQPCKSDESATHPLEQLKCKPGWTNWIKLTTSTTGEKKKEDTEPLQIQSLLTKLEQSSRCDVSQMVHIECRTVGTHTPARKTGLAVECSLEKGLVCKSAGRQKTCRDFEIRVFCKCN